MAALLPFKDVARLPLDDYPSVGRWYRQFEEIDAWRDPFKGLDAHELPLDGTGSREAPTA